MSSTKYEAHEWSRLIAFVVLSPILVPLLFIAIVLGALFIAFRLLFFLPYALVAWKTSGEWPDFGDFLKN